MTFLRLPTSKSQTKFKFWYWMIPVLLLNVVLASQGLNKDVIWFDELTSIGHAGGLTGPYSPIEIMQSIQQHSPKHAPLFFEILAGWGAIVGWHHTVLRILSLYFGVLTVAWVYRIGKDSINWQTGIGSAVFLGLNVFWIEYYHEIRMYTLQILLVMVLLWHYIYLSDTHRKVRRYHWLALVILATTTLYTQPFSFFVHVGIGFYHLLLVAKTRRWFKITGAFLLAGLLYLPWLPVTYFGLNSKFDTSADAMSLEQAISVFIRLLSNGNWLILLILLVVAIFQFRFQMVRQKTKAIWILTILIFGLLLFINEVIGLIPLRRARYFFIVWGFGSLIMGIGFVSLRYRWVRIIILAIYIGSGFALREASDYQDYQGTIFAVNFYPPMQDYVVALDGKVRPQDYVVGFTDANFVNHKGKHDKSTADYYMEAQLGTDGIFIPSYFDADDLQTDIPKKLANHPDLLLTYNPFDKPENFDTAIDIIERDYVTCEIVINQPDLYVKRYVHRTLDCDRDYQPIVYDNGVTIVDKHATIDAELGTVRILTGWEVADEQLLYEYNVSLQIVTADWQNVAQTDRHLHDDLLKWYVADLPIDGLEAGDYRVIVIVYNRDTGEKVTGTDLTTGETGTLLPITVFTIEG